MLYTGRVSRWILRWWFDEAADGASPRRLWPKRGVVPDVTSMLVDDARTVLANDGFRIEIVRVEQHPASEPGIVLAQEPPAGTKHRRAIAVRLTVLHRRELGADEDDDRRAGEDSNLRPAD